MYRLWFFSPPFDIGITTKRGLYTLVRSEIAEEDLVKATYENVKN